MSFSTVNIYFCPQKHTKPQQHISSPRCAWSNSSARVYCVNKKGSAISLFARFEATTHNDRLNIGYSGSEFFCVWMFLYLFSFHYFRWPRKWWRIFIYRCYCFRWAYEHNSRRTFYKNTKRVWFVNVDIATATTAVTWAMMKYSISLCRK